MLPVLLPEFASRLAALKACLSVVVPFGGRGPRMVLAEALGCFLGAFLGCSWFCSDANQRRAGTYMAHSPVVGGNALPSCPDESAGDYSGDWRKLLVGGLLPSSGLGRGGVASGEQRGAPGHAGAEGQEGTSREEPGPGLLLERCGVERGALERPGAPADGTAACGATAITAEEQLPGEGCGSVRCGDQAAAGAAAGANLSSVSGPHGPAAESNGQGLVLRMRPISALQGHDAGTRRTLGRALRAALLLVHPNLNGRHGSGAALSGACPRAYGLLPELS